MERSHKLLKIPTQSNTGDLLTANLPKSLGLSTVLRPRRNASWSNFTKGQKGLAIHQLHNPT